MRSASFAKPTRVLLIALAITVGMLQSAGAQQQDVQENSQHMLTYSRGEAVLPVYHGWHPNADGTIDLWFGYLNQNWREETDVPVGPNNTIDAPWGPDAGQPTHFLPRNNRWVFKITVPKDFGNKEIVWTLTTHGKTYRAYATLHPGYVKDDFGLQREYFGQAPPEGNERPTVVVEGPQTRTVKVGEESLMTVVVTDDGQPRTGRNSNANADAAAAPPSRPGANNQNQAPRASICGSNRAQFFCGEPNEGAGSLFNVKGLRMNCFLYRGDPERSSAGDFGHAANVVFDPPQEKAWEDHRGGSPWAAGYVIPPLPKDNTWNIKTTFKEVGTYVVACQAHDGNLSTTTLVTYNVTP
jgi:hypothetical protein